MKRGYRDRLKSGILKLRRQLKAAGAVPNPAPVVVLGKEKSGTTAIAALLADMTGSSVTLDIPEIWAPTELALKAGEQSMAGFIREHPLAFSTDIVKEPCLTFLFDELTEAMPAARWVMITRDPRSNIRSVLNRVSLPGDAESLTPQQLAGVPIGWRSVLEGSWLGIDAAHYIDVAALRWNLAARVYLDNAERMALVRYEDFLTDKIGTLTTLAAQLGMPVQRDVSDRADEQFQPRGDRAVSWAGFFGPENLDRIAKITAGPRAELGYA